MSTKLLLHSNAPWVPTGYGNQTALFAPYLAREYELAISSFYGLEGAPIKWENIPVFAGLGGEYGNTAIPQHAKRYFGGDPRGGIVMTLLDVWVLDPAMARQVNMVCWVPVDHDPAPPAVVDFLLHSEAIPVAMSKFGQQMLGRLDPLYCPHGVDTQIYQPLDKQAVRQGAFPDGAFVVGIVAANKGRPSRKGFAQALMGFAKFAEKHENAFLYLHTVLDSGHGMGEDIPRLMNQLAIPEERVRIADQYTMLHNPYSASDMARIYGAMDVLLNPAWGEGFGIPVLEAQSCGVPAVVTDFSAMREVCDAGWHVRHIPHWTGQNSWQAIPDVGDIVAALEECEAMGPAQRERLSKQARRHAMGYDVRKVFRQHMLPTLRVAQQRLTAREPVRIPARSKVAA